MADSRQKHKESRFTFYAPFGQSTVASLLLISPVVESLIMIGVIEGVRRMRSATVYR